MKRPKIVIGIFITLILVVLTIVLLACTVFVVRDITVVKAVSSRLLDEDVIVASSKLKKGTSIISLDKQEIKEEIERANPYVEVVAISREFPNEVIIEVTVRTAVMLVPSEDASTFALLDDDMKVLDVFPQSETDYHMPIVNDLTFVVPEQGAQSLVGSHITFADATRGALLSDILSAAGDPSIKLSGNSFRAFFKEISFTSGTRILLKTQKGVSFVLDTSLESDLFSQLYMCLNVFSLSSTNVDRSKGYILYEKKGMTAAYNWVESLD
ncbi:MAG TPA: hypothetical protein DIC18_01985 [Clostridiales bacterium]|nr:hypothetical protein [Clostridiales bacterium]